MSLADKILLNRLNHYHDAFPIQCWTSSEHAPDSDIFPSSPWMWFDCGFTLSQLGFLRASFYWGGGGGSTWPSLQMALAPKWADRSSCYSPSFTWMSRHISLVVFLRGQDFCRKWFMLPWLGQFVQIIFCGIINLLTCPTNKIYEGQSLVESFLEALLTCWHGQICKFQMFIPLYLIVLYISYLYHCLVTPIMYFISF